MLDETTTALYANLDCEVKCEGRQDVTHLIIDLQMHLRRLAVEHAAFSRLRSDASKRSFRKRIAVRVSSSVSEIHDLIAEHFRVASENVERWQSTKGATEDGGAEGVRKLIVGGVQLDLFTKLDIFFGRIATGMLMGSDQRRSGHEGSRLAYCWKHHFPPSSSLHCAPLLGRWPSCLHADPCVR